MKLGGRVSAPVTLALRTTGWLIGLVIVGGLILGFGSFRLSQHVGECVMGMKGQAASSLDFAKQMVACAEKRSGPLERSVLYYQRKALDTLPNVPCRYVGVWTATRPPTARMGEVEYRVTLRDDSKFTAVPVRSTQDEIITGSWGVYKGGMLWFYDQGIVWPPDVNPIRHTNDDLFYLRERDGTPTTYALIARTPSSNCRPDKTFAAQAAPAAQTQAAAPAAPAGPPRMRPVDGMSLEQRADFERLVAGYVESVRVVANATVCNHPEADARRRALYEEITRRHGTDEGAVMAGVIAAKPPAGPVPCEVTATQIVEIKLPEIPASLLLRPGEPVDRVRHTGKSPTGTYQLVARGEGEPGRVEYRVVHREKVAFSSPQPFESQRLVPSPIPVLLLATRDTVLQCLDNSPQINWQAVSLPEWGDAVTSKLQGAECLVVAPYTDTTGRLGLCAQEAGSYPQSSRLYRIEDHGLVSFIEQRKGACPRER